MATLKEVAKWAGVGLATASRAIAASGHVSPEAAERVRLAVEALGYRPSSIGRAMATHRWDAVGLFVPDYADVDAAVVLDAMIREVRRVSRHVIVTSGNCCGTGQRNAVAAVRELVERDCDGILVVAQGLGEAELEEMARMSARIVFINRPFPGKPEAAFHAEHGVGGELVAAHLWGLGHRHFAFVYDSFSTWGNAAKLAGFRAELFVRGVAMESIEIFEAGKSYQGGYEAAGRILRSGFAGTAIFCGNDALAVGAIAALRNNGCAVPSDISVVGYGDSDPSRCCSPSLSTVVVPVAKITGQATRALLSQCYGTEWQKDQDFSLTFASRGSSSEVWREGHA